MMQTATDVIYETIASFQHGPSWSLAVTGSTMGDGCWLEEIADCSASSFGLGSCLSVLSSKLRERFN